MRQLIDLIMQDDSEYMLGYQSRKGICQLDFVVVVVLYTDLERSFISF